MESDKNVAADGVALYRQSLKLVPANREAGHNKCGMVVFRLTYKAPEVPLEGRDIILVANDITYSAGSFGPVEDAVFKAAVDLSIADRIPAIYVAANSGARVGLAKELMDKFKVAWVDNKDPTKGFDFLFLEQADYEALVEAAGGPKAPS